MRLKEILYIILTLVLLASCSTTEKFSVYAPEGTKIYTPDNTVTPSGITSNSGKVDLAVSSDMYCGFILAQSAGSDLKIPIGLDYKTKHHTGTKVALYTGAVIAGAGLGVTVGSSFVVIGASINGDSESSDKFGIAAAAGAVAGGVGAAIMVPSQARLRQTSYDYNFGYEKNQTFKIPELSTTLLNPNNPKGYENSPVSQKGSSTHRKKASSGKDVKPENISSSKANRSRSDHAKKIEGKYNGSGTLLLGKTINEKYSEIAVLIERIDKTHVSVRIIESDDDYFEAPLVYEIHVNKKGGYDLNIVNLPEASMEITKRGKLTFKHKKVNIDNQIYTLEIKAQKGDE